MEKKKAAEKTLALQVLSNSEVAGANINFVPLVRAIFCTGTHKFPQSSFQITLANFSRCSYYSRRLIGKKNFTSQFEEAARVKPSEPQSNRNREENFAIPCNGGGQGNTEPVSVKLDQGVSFAAEFTAKRVKPRRCGTQAEARRFASALKGAARVTPRRDRELN
ncbi:MAG: hypothetical protein WA581_20005 [Candidatus Acidiferrales bacterium]